LEDRKRKEAKDIKRRKSEFDSGNPSFLFLVVLERFGS